MGTGFFPGVKWPRRGADHPPPSSAEVTNEYSYSSTPPLGLRFLLEGELYLLSDTENFIVLVSQFGTKEFSVSNLRKANSPFMFFSQERGQCLI
jgi:hypothetical protein